MRAAFRYWRYLWALPVTLVGLLLACLAIRHGRLQAIDGALEAHGPWVQWMLTHCVPLDGGAGAITFGHVVLGCDARVLDATRAHERVHVHQYERWGVLFLPAYLLASAYAAARGGHYYFDNTFEREAAARAPLLETRTQVR
jgi:hypothetical protein